VNVEEKLAKKHTHNIAREHSYWIISTIDPKAIDGAGCNTINTAISTQVSRQSRD
jgi:hypothetical protein